MEEEIHILNELKAASETFVRFTQLQITNMANLWAIAKPEQRRRVQKLLFKTGLEYSSELGFLNPPNLSSLFQHSCNGAIKDDRIRRIQKTPLLSIEPAKAN